MAAPARARVTEPRVSLDPGREVFLRYAARSQVSPLLRHPFANFLGEFGIYEMLEFPSGFEPALPP